MELIFLGTGAGLPSRSRNVTSLALMLNKERGTSWLFDCGEGTQHQILKSRIKPGKIEKIFISHLHGDHIFGLPGLLSSRSFQGGVEKVEIYGPRGIRKYIECSLSVSHSRLSYEVEVIEVSEGEIFNDGQFKVIAFEMDHVMEAYGFRVEEADKPGALDMKALSQFDIPRGPLLGELKAGKTITLDSGEVICGSDFLLEPKKGMVIAVSGDTRKTPSALALAKDADWLVHESTFKKGQEENALTFGHTTNVEAAEIARDAGVENLILYHISSRFAEEEMGNFLNEAKEIFEQTTIVADFDEIKL